MNNEFRTEHLGIIDIITQGGSIINEQWVKDVYTKFDDIQSMSDATGGFTSKQCEELAKFQMMVYEYLLGMIEAIANIYDKTIGYLIKKLKALIPDSGPSVLTDIAKWIADVIAFFKDIYEYCESVVKKIAESIKQIIELVNAIWDRTSKLGFKMSCDMADFPQKLKNRMSQFEQLFSGIDAALQIVPGTGLVLPGGDIIGLITAPFKNIPKAKILNEIDFTKGWNGFVRHSSGPVGQNINGLKFVLIPSISTHTGWVGWKTASAYAPFRKYPKYSQYMVEFSEVIRTGNLNAELIWMQDGEKTKLKPGQSQITIDSLPDDYWRIYVEHDALSMDKDDMEVLTLSIGKITLWGLETSLSKRIDLLEDENEI